MVGWVSPYFDHIAITKWLNQTFGYSLTVAQYLQEFDEWQLNMHLYYADTFNDPSVIREANKRRVRERLDRKGHFSIDYEIPRQKE